VRSPLLIVPALCFAQTDWPGAPFVGSWSSNLSKSQVPASYQYQRLVLQFAIVLDTFTVGSTTFVLS
jgi:hypothetical protein